VLDLDVELGTADVRTLSGAPLRGSQGAAGRRASGARRARPPRAQRPPPPPPGRTTQPGSRRRPPRGWAKGIQRWSQAQRSARARPLRTTRRRPQPGLVAQPQGGQGPQAGVTERRTRPAWRQEGRPQAKGTPRRRVGRTRLWWFGLRRTQGPPQQQRSRPTRLTPIATAIAS
jgi:hypothetical protein